jgi:hypothetical protein
MANPTTNYGWPMPTSSDLVTDLPADFDAFGQPVDNTLKALNPETTLGDISYRSAVSNTNTRLGIGTAGQVLAVSGGVPAWTTTADVTPLTTKGDLFTFTTEDARIGVGADGTVLTAASGEATGLQWAAPAGASALTFTGSASPSASAAFSILNCFSATYRNYLVVFDGSLTADTLIRFGTSGTANSTSNYTYRGYYNISSLTGLYTNQATSFKTLDHGSVAIGGTIRIQSPFATRRTCYQWDLIGANGSTTALDANLAGFFDDTTSFTDLNFSTSGTFTGNVFVYGLSNS